MNLKNVIIFVTGVVTGAGTTYLALVKHTKNEIETRVNKEVERLNGVQSEEIPVEVKSEIKEETEEAEPEERSESDMEKYKEALKRTDYTKAVTSSKVTTMTDAVNEKADELIDKAVKKTTKKTKVPKKVTQDEFDSTAETGRMTLYYYADGVLADDEDIVYDPTETMGATNFKNFKSTYDTVYIFNYATNMMYEIMPSNSKYADVVGGDFDR